MGNIAPFSKDEHFIRRHFHSVKHTTRVALFFVFFLYFEISIVGTLIFSRDRLVLYVRVSTRRASTTVTWSQKGPILLPIRWNIDTSQHVTHSPRRLYYIRIWNIKEVWKGGASVQLKKKKKKREKVSVWSVPATERHIAPASGCSYSVLYYKTESNFLFSLLPALSHGTASSYINIKIKWKRK